MGELEEDLELEEDQVLVVLVEIQEDLEQVDLEETMEDQEQAVAQDLEAMVETLEDQDLVVTLGCQVMVDLVVESHPSSALYKPGPQSLVNLLEITGTLAPG